MKIEDFWDSVDLKMEEERADCTIDVNGYIGQERLLFQASINQYPKSIILVD